MTSQTGKATREFRLNLTYDHGTGDLQPYFDGLLAGQATASNCPVCGKAWFPPRAVCPDDRTQTRWSRLTGSGTVLSVTTTRTKLPFTAAADTYTFVLVAMDGAENAVLGRMQGKAVSVAAGTRVDLAAPAGEPAHPAQAVQFVVKES